MGKPLRSLIIPEEAEEDVTTFVTLSTEQLEKLGRTLRDKGNAGREAESVVADALSLNEETAIGVLVALRNLREQRRSLRLSDGDLLDDLAVFGGPAAGTPQATALLSLLEAQYLVEKVGALRHAMGPHLVEAKTVVDLRPVFNEDHSAVEAFLLVSFLQLTVHEKYADYKTVSVQLSEADLQRLRETLADAERKVDHLKTQFSTVEKFQ